MTGPGQCKWCRRAVLFLPRAGERGAVVVDQAPAPEEGTVLVDGDYAPAAVFPDHAMAVVASFAREGELHRVHRCPKRPKR